MAAKADKPILFVQQRDRDIQQRVFSGFGPPTEIVPVNPALRKKLSGQLSEVAALILPAAKRYPDIPSVINLKLRQEALAKTHRPMELLERAGMRPIGTRKFGELLLPATPESITNLSRIISQNDAQKIKANISTIESFSVYSQRDVFNKDSLDETELGLKAWVSAGKPLLLERFTSDEEVVDDAILAALDALLQKAEAETVHQSTHGLQQFSRLIKLKSIDQVFEIASFPGVRALVPAQEFAPIKINAQWFNRVGTAKADTLPTPEKGLPTVAVVDTGISPNDKTLAPWVVGRDAYLMKPDTDYLHGTFVSGLIAGGRNLNGNDAVFPDCSATILDVAALGINGNTDLNDMLDRIEQSLRGNPTVKIWNCSFGTPKPGSPDLFGMMARELDVLADRHGVLFVIAAGNYAAAPLRCWPCTHDYAGEDRISEPAESVRALTVGSVAHIDALVATGEPSPFTRRGPGPAKTPKPDITHYGGNCDANGAFGGAGVRSILPGGIIGESIGTSFATPLASALAANVWQALERNKTTVRPDIVKALMIHAAAINAPKRNPDEHNYHGFGVPDSVLETLFCADDCFTLMFDAELFDGQIWEKTPFPIPACLHPDGTHFRGEIILTLVYSPPVDGRHGSEYVRANINAHFGTYDADEDGVLKHKGILPLDTPDKRDLAEEAMIDHGFKWSPVKVYRTAFRRGKAGGNFRLYLEMLRRAGEPSRREAQHAVVLITMRGISGETEVYNDGIRALNQKNWVANNVATKTRVRT